MGEKCTMLVGGPTRPLSRGASVRFGVEISRCARSRESGIGDSEMNAATSVVTETPPPSVYRMHHATKERFARWAPYWVYRKLPLLKGLR